MSQAPKALGTTLLVGAFALCCTAVTSSAQPLTLTVAPGGDRTFTDAEGTWRRVPQSELWATEARYDEPSGVRIGRGSVIPDWIEAAPMRNVSIRELTHYQNYAYFVVREESRSSGLRG